MADCTPLLQDIVDGSGDLTSFPVPPQTLTPIDINAAGGFPITVQAATAGQLTRLFRLVLVADGATIISFKDGATVLPGKLKMAAGEMMILDQGNFPWYQGTANTDFKLNSTNAVQLTGAAYINMNPT